MFYKYLLLVLLLFVVSNCTSIDKSLNNLGYIGAISFEKKEISEAVTFKRDSNNYLFKEYLNRIIKSEKKVDTRFHLIISITFEVNNSVSQLDSINLTKTVGIVKFKLYETKTNKLIKTGLIKSSPAIGSTSSSLFSNDINLNHIKERLNKNLALKLSKQLNIIIQRLK